MGRLVLTRPGGRSRPTFALTPLIDVMFLLLIFFMLSSQIAPYSLMPVSDVASGAEGDAAPPGAAPSRDLALRVSNGFVSVGGERVALEALGPALAGFVRQGMTGFLVVPTATATVQDVVTTLEALQGASARNVTLVSTAGSGR